MLAVVGLCFAMLCHNIFYKAAKLLFYLSVAAQWNIFNNGQHYSTDFMDQKCRKGTKGILDFLEPRWSDPTAGERSAEGCLLRCPAISAENQWDLVWGSGVDHLFKVTALLACWVGSKGEHPDRWMEAVSSFMLQLWKSPSISSASDSKFGNIDTWY